MHDVTPLIIGIGEALIDKLPTGDVVGGAPLNFAVRAAELSDRFGCMTALVTRIGDDQDGRSIRDRLSETKLDLSALQTDAHLPTGYVNVVLDPQGQPSYTIGRDVAWDVIEYDPITKSLASRASAICFGTLVQLGKISQATLFQFLTDATEAIKVLDLNLRQPLPSRSTIAMSLEAADVLKCNLDELRHLAEAFDLEERTDGVRIASQLQSEFQLRGVFWTRGEAGCCWQSGDIRIVMPVPRLAAEPNADSVGAGDAATAALTLGLVLNWSPERIVAAANLCGAFAASRRGPTAPLTDEILNKIASYS